MNIMCWYDWHWKHWLRSQQHHLNELLSFPVVCPSCLYSSTGQTSIECFVCYRCILRARNSSEYSSNFSAPWACILIGRDNNKQATMGGSTGREPACDAGDLRDAGSVPGSGRSPGGGNGNPLQYSRLGQSHRVRHDWSNLACMHTCDIQEVFWRYILHIEVIVKRLEAKGFMKRESWKLALLK